MPYPNHSLMLNGHSVYRFLDPSRFQLGPGSDALNGIRQMSGQHYIRAF